MIVRSKRSDSFTVINNIALTDTRISFRAKGVLAYLLSKPDEWRVSERQLASEGHEGVTAIRAALKELENAGYVERRRSQGQDGRFEWDSVVFDVPNQAGERRRAQHRPQAETPCLENISMEPCLGFPCTENHPMENHAMETCAVVNTIVTSTINNTPTPAAVTQQPATPPTPTPAGPPEMERIPAVTVKATPTVKPSKSPYMPAGMHLPGGYVPAGTGVNPVQVYYERFHWSDPDAHLNRPQEDDLARLCPDLDRLREVVTAYSRANYRSGNVNLILDWYRQGVPDKSAAASRMSVRHGQSRNHGAGSTNGRQSSNSSGGKAPRKGPVCPDDFADDPEMRDFLLGYLNDCEAKQLAVATN